MKNVHRVGLMLTTLMFLLTGCGGKGQAPQSSQPDYKSVKTMVLDIMQTDEAKKAVSKMMKDDKFKQSMILDESTLRTTLIQSIAKPNNPQIKEAFQDPKFTAALAKTMKSENKALIKELMKDPEYQKLMIDIMKDPEYEKNMLNLMKSSAYRKQMMQVMKESMKSPLFQADLMKIMESVTEDMMKPKQTTTSKQAKGAHKGKKKGGAKSG